MASATLSVNEEVAGLQDAELLEVLGLPAENEPVFEAAVREVCRRLDAMPQEGRVRFHGERVGRRVEMPLRLP
jgi:hypothetical protein